MFTLRSTLLFREQKEAIKQKKSRSRWIVNPKMKNWPPKVTYLSIFQHYCGRCSGTTSAWFFEQYFDWATKQIRHGFNGFVAYGGMSFSLRWMRNIFKTTSIWQVFGAWCQITTLLLTWYWTLKLVNRPLFFVYLCWLFLTRWSVDGRSTREHRVSSRNAVWFDSRSLHTHKPGPLLHGGKIQFDGVWSLPQGLLSGPSCVACGPIWPPTNEHCEAVLPPLRGYLLPQIHTAQPYVLIPLIVAIEWSLHFRSWWSLLWDNLSTSVAPDVPWAVAAKATALLCSEDLRLQDSQECKDQGTS